MAAFSAAVLHVSQYIKHNRKEMANDKKEKQMDEGGGYFFHTDYLLAAAGPALKGWQALREARNYQMTCQLVNQRLYMERC